MTDTVFVTGLAVHAYHGVMDHEATVGQTFRLDLVLDVDLSTASRSDKLAHTVGYDQIVNVASLAFCTRRHRLVEAAAGAVAEAVLSRFTQVARVKVTSPERASRSGGLTRAAPATRRPSINTSVRPRTCSSIPEMPSSLVRARDAPRAALPG